MESFKHIQKYPSYQDFPSGAVDKTLPASATNAGAVPGLGRFRVLQSSRARAPQPLKPSLLEPRRWSKRNHRGKQPRSSAAKRCPRSPLGKAGARQRRPSTVKNKYQKACVVICDPP